MKIKKPELFEQDGELVYSVKVSFQNEVKNLWYKVDKAFSELVSDRSDAALLALLIPAMAKGEDIEIEGKISEKLYYNLSGRYQHILKLIIPSLYIIKIFPSNISSEVTSGKGVATGFSAGIDSFSVLADHFYKKVSPNYTISHLLFNNVGSHGKGQKSKEVFNKRFESLRYQAEQLGLPLIRVNSNQDEFYEGFDFMQTHTPRNTSVALLLQKGIGKFLYASAYIYEDLYIRASKSMAASDALTLPMISTEGLEAFSVGSEYTRVEKTMAVSAIKDSYESLDVCGDPDPQGYINCGRCEKCKRTILTLEIIGKLDNYEKIFDLKEYYKERTREKYISYVLNSKNPLHREIKRYANEYDFKIPLYAKISAKTGKGIFQFLRRNIKKYFFSPTN